MSIVECNFCGAECDLVIGPGVSICRRCIVLAYRELTPADVAAARREIGGEVMSEPWDDGRDHVADERLVKAREEADRLWLDWSVCDSAVRKIAEALDAPPDLPAHTIADRAVEALPGPAVALSIQGWRSTSDRAIEEVLASLIHLYKAWLAAERDRRTAGLTASIEEAEQYRLAVLSALELLATVAGRRVVFDDAKVIIEEDES